MSKCAVLFFVVFAIGLASAGPRPLLSMRLRANDTDTEEIWRSNFKAIKENPGCCDEIWFSTGIGTPSLDWHHARAEVIARAAADLRSMGIVPSLQFQATIGHGDSFGSPEMSAMKTWTGWTGWRGVETKYCNCPRQPEFHKYLRDVSAIYARVGFASLWIDDDLRVSNHQPSDSFKRHIGCFCNTCVGAFNAESGGRWTRETLASALETDDALLARWRRFSIEGLCRVAKTIAEVFVEESPETMLALQHGCGPQSVDQVSAILKTLHEVSGRPVGFRPGGGAYYDDNPSLVVLKSLDVCRFRGLVGNPEYVKVWTPEIESWPRTYYSRSPQGVLAEGFSALMYGMSSMSFFISNSAKEDPQLYGRTMWKSLAAAAPVIRGYAKTIAGCTPVGYVIPGRPGGIGIRRIAIPVLSGIGRSVGELTKSDCERDVNKMTSSEVQALRDELDRRVGGMPVLVKSPFMGLVQAHVDADGNLRSVALMNLRISEQGPIRIQLRNVPDSWKSAVWREMCHEPVNLPIEKKGGDAFVTVPSVGAWNGGYVSGVCHAPACDSKIDRTAKPRPVPDKRLLKRMRAGIDTIGIVHFTVNTFTDREWGYGSESPNDFNPVDFSADQIVEACRDGGIQGLVIVAKHHDGFCLWPTKTTEHNISRSNWMDGKGDYVGAMEKACRKYGLKFGVYCSPWDRNNAAYATPEYVKTFHAQVEELNDGRYGEVFEMWFDGANGGDGYYGGAWEKRPIGVAREYYQFERLWERVLELQPDVCFFGGKGGFMYPGNESGIVPPESGGTRENGSFRIYEADFPMRPGWFYHKSQDGYSCSGEFIMKVYLRTVGNGAIMDIGISPDQRGRLSDEDVGCLRRFAEIRREFFSTPVKDPSKPFNVIVMTEDIEHGERVDEWRVVLDGKELAKGGKIGTKRIRVLDEPVSGKDLKLEITKGDATVEEIKLELFFADEALVRKVMSSSRPARPPAPFERRGVLASRDRKTLVYMMKRPADTSSLLITPDVNALDGTPVAFRVAYSLDGEKWEEDPTEYHLDNVAANPIPQSVALGRKVRVKYLRLSVVRTLGEGAAVRLKGVEFVD